MDPAQQEIERDPNADYGDALSEEQIAEAAEAEKLGTMSDEEVKAAVDAMTGIKEQEEKSESKNEAEAETKEKAKKEEGEKKESDFIPKGRFDEAVGNERERGDRLERELQELKDQFENQKQPASKVSEPSIDTKITDASQLVRKTRKEWQAAIIDNDATKADGLLDQLNDAEDYLDALRLEKAETSARSGAFSDVSFEQRLSQLEKEFPALDQNSDEYDGTIDKKLTRLFNGLVNGGASRVEALNEAAEVYLVPTKKAPEPKSKANNQGGDKKTETEETLRGEARKTLKETLEAQPPETEGKAETKIPALQPSRMTMKQFGELDEEAKAVLRGDYVE